MSGATGLDYFTLTIASAGFGLAVLALGWQVFTWLNEGGRVKVNPPTFVIVMPDGLDAYSVRVRNVGRSAVEITGVFCRVGEQRFVMVPPAGGPALPLSLEGLHSTAWAFPAASLRQTLATVDTRGRMMWVGVTTGTGREVWSPKRRPLDASPPT